MPEQITPPMHSVTSAALLLTISQLVTSVEAYKPVLSTNAVESLFRSLGALSSQADMLVYLEQIPAPTPAQVDLRQQIREDALEMVQLVGETLTELSVAFNPGEQHG